MSIRNYHAFIRAARKTGGLSLPSARKVYHKVKARLGEQPKGKDVKLHPRIFRESLVARDRKKFSAALAEKRTERAKRKVVSLRPERAKRKAVSLRPPVSAKPKGKAGAPISIQPTQPVEYAASSDYKRLRVQVHVLSVGPRTHRQLSEAANAWMRRQPLPEGVSVLAIEWANKGKDFTKETNPRRARIVAENFRKIGMDFR